MKALPLLLMMIALSVPVGALAQDSIEVPSNPASEETQNTPSQTASPAQAPASTTRSPRVPHPISRTPFQTAEPLPRDLVHWNEYHGPHFTIRVGASFLYDFAAYAQDAASKEQITMLPGEKLRDFRFIMGGRLPSIPLPTTWCAGVMYDGPTHSWFLRQTGVMFGYRRS